MPGNMPRTSWKPCASRWWCSNSDLKILTANHSFYDTFKVTPEETIGNFIYDLGNRQWDIPKLRVLFEEILPHDTVIQRL